jgi:hypothetical protein
VCLDIVLLVKVQSGKRARGEKCRAAKNFRGAEYKMSKLDIASTVGKLNAGPQKISEELNTR